MNLGRKAMASPQMAAQASVCLSAYSFLKCVVLLTLLCLISGKLCQIARPWICDFKEGYALTNFNLLKLFWFKCVVSGKDMPWKMSICSNYVGGEGDHDYDYIHFIIVYIMVIYIVITKNFIYISWSNKQCYVNINVATILLLIILYLLQRFGCCSL